MFQLQILVVAQNLRSLKCRIQESVAMAEASAPEGPFRPDVRDCSYWRYLIESNLTDMGRDYLVHGRLDPHQIFDNLDGMYLSTHAYDHEIESTR